MELHIRIDGRWKKAGAFISYSESIQSLVKDFLSMKSGVDAVKIVKSGYEVEK